MEVYDENGELAESAQDNPEVTEQTEGVGTETSTETEVAEVTENFYSPEDLEALHPTAIDLDRVRPEARPIVEKTIKEYKSLNADYTRKSQEYAELKRIVEAVKPKNENKTIEDYFEEDPKGTLAFIDQQIVSKKNEAKALRAAGDTDAAQGALELVNEWTNTKATLVANRVFKQEEKMERLAVPEFEKKSDDATEYLKGIGMDEGRIATLLKDPYMVKHFSSLKAQADAKITAKGKVVKTSPTELGRPGGATSVQQKPVGARELFTKAKNSGRDEDWAQYLKATGNL